MPVSPLQPRNSWAFPAYYSQCDPDSQSDVIERQRDIPIPELLARTGEVWAPPPPSIGIVITGYPEEEGQPQPSISECILSLTERYLKQNVTRLCLHDVDAPRILAACHNVHDLYLTHATPALFLLIQRMTLRRLSTHIGDLLAQSRAERLTHRVFSTITHLTLFDAVRTSTWAQWADLAQLPVLTHLSFAGEIPPPILHAVLANCTALKVLLNQWRQLSELQPAAYCEECGIADDRFVMYETDESVHEWETTARGLEDIWTRAEWFIADKRVGRISESLFWIYREDGSDSDFEESDSESEPEGTSSWEGAMIPSPAYGIDTGGEWTKRDSS
ncbi:hypothetical protein C8R46DRAFT_1341849 [Mycena filopes]|nr:hypothetical protein C8R46DRAFT_1341849 [Mycena filopes]